MGGNVCAKHEVTFHSRLSIGVMHESRESLYVSLHLLNAHKLEHWMLLCIRYAYLHSTKNQYKQLDTYIEFGMGLFSRNQRRFQKCTGQPHCHYEEWEVTQRVGGRTKSGRSHKEWEVTQRVGGQTKTTNSVTCLMNSHVVAHLVMFIVHFTHHPTSFSMNTYTVGLVK